MIIGHQAIIDFFNHAIKSGNLSHAYCFLGYNQVGKRTVARNIGAKLLATTEEKLFQHPDFCYLERETDEKTGKLKKNISIAQARTLRLRAQNRSWMGGYQVVIIDEAELLNAESANALLKSLEEPGEKRVFFLLAENESAVLPTVRSRCQLFFFNLVSEAEIKTGLTGMGYEAGEAERAADFSWGRPGRARELAEDPEKIARYIAELQRWTKIAGAPFYGKLKAIEELFAGKEDTVRRQRKLQKVLDIWIMLWRDLMLMSSGQNTNNEWAVEISKIKKIEAPATARFITALEETKVLLSQNINAPLLFEQLLLKI